MAAASTRVRPLVAVLSRAPLVVEALAGAFEGIADVVAVSAEAGLMRAYDPDVAIVESFAPELIDDAVLCLRVDLDENLLSVRLDGRWSTSDVALSPEAIRNVAVSSLYGGATA
jgi:hypothetical protein